MRAAVFHGPRDVRIEQVPDPASAPGRVVIRNLVNGLCGSDLHLFQGDLTGGIPVPAQFGHEFCGEVVEVGQGVAGIGIGDLVTVEPLESCGSCRDCRAGSPNVCWDARWYAATGSIGGLSEFASVASGSAHLLPDGVSTEQGALVEPMAVAYHACRTGAATPGDRVVVLGAGPIGIGVALGMRALGVDDVVVAEPVSLRRAALEALGVARVVGPSAEAILDAYGGPADLVIDAAGVQAAFDAAVEVLGPRGRLVIVAMYGGEVAFRPVRLLTREVSVRLSCAYAAGDFAAVIGHVAAGRYPTAPWVEHVALGGLDEAFGRLERGEAAKLLVDVAGVTPSGRPTRPG
jgi:(R,R)-butanediol dehydrogenase/meso-butanediol dehydrogenase/diacetyl reductase